MKYQFLKVTYIMYVFLYSWMGRGIVDVPVREVAEFIKDVQNNMSWDNFLIVSIASVLKYCSYCMIVHLLFTINRKPGT